MKWQFQLGANLPPSQITSHRTKAQFTDLISTLSLSRRITNHPSSGLTGKMVAGPPVTAVADSRLVEGLPK